MNSKELETDDVDLDKLKEFMKSLTCSQCSLLPRPNTIFYRCLSCSPEKIYCQKCKAKGASCDYNCRVFVDPALMKLSSIFKKNPCSYVKNGCQDSATEQNLPNHEEACSFRNVACPVLGCGIEIVFQNIKQHFIINHNKKFHEKVIEFKGNLETLKTTKFAMTAYHRNFFPQFSTNDGPFSMRSRPRYINDPTFLYFWIIADTSSTEEAETFLTKISFYDENGKLITAIDDTTQPLLKQEINDDYGYMASAVPLKKIRNYLEPFKELDRIGGIYRTRENIHFEVEIICPKLDEIAQCENVESGVEDTDEESKD